MRHDIAVPLSEVGENWEVTVVANDAVSKVAEADKGHGSGGGAICWLEGAVRGVRENSWEDML